MPFIDPRKCVFGTKRKTLIDSSDSWRTNSSPGFLEEHAYKRQDECRGDHSGRRIYAGRKHEYVWVTSSLPPTLDGALPEEMSKWEEMIQDGYMDYMVSNFNWPGWFYGCNSCSKHTLCFNICQMLEPMKFYITCREEKIQIIYLCSNIPLNIKFISNIFHKLKKLSQVSHRWISVNVIRSKTAPCIGLRPKNYIKPLYGLRPLHIGLRPL